ncbi:MAG: homoserine kinase [Acidobacteria bacterium]|nr:homoserine kinase [Acidobacteriota bacterium]
MTETPFRLRLPATSANLGSGFDTAAVALDFYLEVEAEPSREFSIHAIGSDSDICSKLDCNLILDTYCRLLECAGVSIQPLAIRMNNEIPLGMGCGSSAAGRLAAIALAVHFGNLGWNSERILEEACALEGHPDNAAACWLGGFVAAAMEGGSVYAARVEPPPAWRAIIVLPRKSLATSAARAILPSSYSSAEVVANLQSVSMLGLAFAQGRGDLLATAMRDRIHQPYRSELCPLLPELLPLAGRGGVLGVALSGAGPAVLVVVRSESEVASARDLIAGATANHDAQLLVSRFANSGGGGEC